MARAATGRALTFRVGTERFGVPAEIVREVARLPRLTRVPHAPDSLLGLANFRGQVLPVLSFAALSAGLDDRGRDGERHVILLDTAAPLALAVDDVSRLAADDDVPLIDIDALTARDFTAVERKARVSARTAETRRIAAESSVTLVAFAVAGQDYALPIAAVEEVLRLPADIALLPHADTVVVGSIAVRDALLPLLSLQALLALPGGGRTDHARVVVVRIGAHRVGLVVDAMRAVLRVPEAWIDAVPSVLTRGSAEARIQAICRLDRGRRLVSVLAVEHLVRDDLTARMMHGAEATMAEPIVVEAFERFLLFGIGTETFGLPIEAVAEVARLPAKLTPLPNAPAFVQGVMNLRGQVVPVIDQARRFGGATSTGSGRRVIVVRLGALQAGFVVDTISDVARVPVSAIRPAPDLGGARTRMFERIATLGEAGRTVMIIGPQELLDQAERDLLAGVGGKLAAAAT